MTDRQWENTNAGMVGAQAFMPAGAAQGMMADYVQGKGATGDDRAYAQWAMRNLSDSELESLARENPNVARYMTAQDLYNIRQRPEEMRQYEDRMNRVRQQFRTSGAATSARNRQLSRRLGFGGTAFAQGLGRAQTENTARELANALTREQAAFQQELNRPDRFAMTERIRGAAGEGLSQAGQIAGRVRGTANTIAGQILDAYLPGAGAAMQAGNAAEQAHTGGIFTAGAEQLRQDMGQVDDSFMPNRTFADSGPSGSTLAFSGGQDEAVAFRNALRRRY